ncbi:MAG: amidohydrolase [Acidobacteriota bacterium]
MEEVMLIEGVDIHIEGLSRFPGLINAHDHLDFALFPRLGRATYPNATAWAKDIYHPEDSPVAEHLRIPKHLRLLWGGLRNLIAGVTTVSHHNPYDASFDDGFPVRVVKNYGWAHSLAFDPDIRARFDATPPNAPFLIHAAEGTDADAAEEIYQLDRLGVLTEHTVLIHAVALDAAGWQLVRERKCSVICCPRSNMFTLGQTLDPPPGIPLALGTDSPLTTEGDLLDEVCAAQRLLHRDVLDMVTTTAARILRLPACDDFLAAPAFAHPPELVVIDHSLRLISPRLAPQLPEALRDKFFPLHIDGRPPVLVRHNIPLLIQETRRYIEAPIRLAGREVQA